LAIIGLGIVVGAFTLMKAASTIRDIAADVTRTIQTVEIMNAIQKVNEERTKAIQEVLNYARERNLTPQQTYELIEKIAEQYTTGDIIKATTALSEADKWKAEADSLRTQRYIWAIGGAGVGALITAIVKR
jgi:glutamyl-tRNA reductase